MGGGCLTPPNEEQLCEQLNEQRSQISRLEERVKAAFLRIDEQKQLSDSVYSLALSVERLTIGQQNTSEQVKRLRTDVDEMKNRPNRRWDLVITTAIGAVVGYLAKLLLGGV